MNLNRSIQILLSSFVPDKCSISLALYELREGARRLQLCGVAGDPSSEEWAHQIVVSTRLSQLPASCGEAEHFSLLYPEGEKIRIFPVTTPGGLVGILCVRPAANTSLSIQVINKLRASSQSLASILALARKIRSYDVLISEISSLHLELADQKISDRARGLLADNESPEAITEHVNRVSESIRFEDDLKATIADIRSQLNVRLLLHKAKEKLQKDKGISEEEAYLTIRHMSRRTRTPLGTIAQEILSRDAGVMKPITSEDGNIPTAAGWRRTA